MNSAVIEVVFKVYADVSFGEEIYLSGNVPALGCNEIARAIPLITSTSDFPWWRTKESIFVPGEPGAVEYRYCIFSGGKFNRWEGNFRVLNLEKDKSVVKATEDKFGDNALKDAVLEKSPQKPVGTVTKDDLKHRSKRFAAWNVNKKVMDHSLSGTDSVIVLSYFLPVVLSRKNNGTWSAAWDKEQLLSSLSLEVSRVVWVGSVRYGNAPIPVEEEDAVAAALNELNCVPVFVNQTMHLKFYEGFCKRSLWLALHHVADVYAPLQQSDKSVKVEQDLWFNYMQVHKMFREKVLEVYQQGDLIWIHGLHLMLLPNILRRRLPSAKIGYFFHTPFPSSEIWRTMARREDLLRGLLGADQIGFHLYEYARHFLTTCHRLLGYNSDMNESGMMSVKVDGRQVCITCIHVGVDMPRMQEVFSSSTGFKSELMAWKNKFPGKIIVSGIDRLERLKAIPLRIMAIDRFLESNPKWIGKIVFPILGITAGERGSDYKQTVHDVKILADRINEKYASLDPFGVVYFEEKPEKEILLAQRLAYFAASDILLITATRDGLNRYPMEFTLARREHGRLCREKLIPYSERLDGTGEPNQGLIIISEFVSSARVMRGAMVINPWTVDEVASALEGCLTMDNEERAERSRRNVEFSARLTSSNWAKYVLNDLKAIEGSSAAPDANYAVGFGLHYKVMSLKVLPLDVRDIARAFRNAHHRLIVMDWGGTLVPNIDKLDKLHAFAVATGHASQEGPSDELTTVLENLCSDPKNLVFVVSGKEMRAISKFFAGIKGLGLGAEHGFYYKWPKDDQPIDMNSSFCSKIKWQTIEKIPDDSWKESAKVVMDIFVQRTHGTYIEQKGNALIWQYSDADPEFGFLQSKELEDHLHSILANYPIEVIRGGGLSDRYVEVRPTGANKGLFLEHAFSNMKTENMEPDFILAIGDDTSDEPMFERIAAIKQDQPQINAFGVTVGKKPTAAKAYLDDSLGVLELLNTLYKTTQRDKKYFSVTDLPSYAVNDISGFANTVKLEQMEFESRLGRPLSRAASDGRLNIGDELPAPLLQKRATSSIESRDSQSLVHPLPSLSISMKDYMSSLSEDHQDDMGGISF